MLEAWVLKLGKEGSTDLKPEVWLSTYPILLRVKPLLLNRIIKFYAGLLFAFKHILNKLFKELCLLNEINYYLCRVFMNFIL